MAETPESRLIDEYVLEEEISRRPMSTVYRAMQPAVNRRVALKIFHIDDNEPRRQQFLRSFMRNVQLIATLEHIRIVPVYDYGVVDEADAYVVMRLLRGSLAEQLQHGPLAYAEAIDIFLQVAAGLAYAHSRGVLHRDLKPDNILLDEFGNAYISDFGLGHLEQIAYDGDNPANPINKAVYDAPETLRGQIYDARADQYSLAAVLYHLLTGHPPVAQKDVASPGSIPPTPASIERANPTVPADIEQIVRRGLSPEPEQRFPTVHAMAAALSTASGRTIGTSTEMRVPVTAAATRLRAARGWMLIPLVALLIIVMIAMVFAQGNTKRTPTVLAGTRGSREAALPSTDDVQRARNALGDHGFIAFIACTTGTQTGQERVDRLRKAATNYGLSFRVYDSGMDRYKQLALLERAQLDGASALILCALDTNVLNTSLDAIQKANLPLVFTAPYKPAYGGVMLDTDDYSLGEKAGAFAGQLLKDEHGGKGNVVILTYPDSGAMSDRLRGITDQLQAVAPEATVVGTYPATTPALAAKAINAVLSQGKHIDVICVATDGAAKWAIDALKAANIPTDAVSVVSINGEQQARDLIAAGQYLRGSVNVDLTAASQMAVDATVRLLAGETLPETLDYAPGDLITRASIAAEATPEATP